MNSRFHVRPASLVRQIKLLSPTMYPSLLLKNLTLRGRSGEGVESHVLPPSVVRRIPPASTIHVDGSAKSADSIEREVLNCLFQIRPPSSLANRAHSPEFPNAVIIRLPT